jgi:magnesium-transporting ATPase (P-type)
MVENNLSVDQSLLNSLNVEQSVSENYNNLVKLGGQVQLCALLGVDVTKGLSKQQVLNMREKFGRNEFPESPMDSYLKLLIGALSDTTLLILLGAATVSLIVGALEDPAEGWIEGIAIFIAIALVANISAGNDYSKQLQFIALEASSAEDDRCSALREGVIEVINPRDLVVGDILVLQVKYITITNLVYFILVIIAS